MTADSMTNDTGWFAQIQKWVYLACAPYGNRSAMRDVYTYLWMRSFSDNEARCWPSLETISIDSGISERSITTVLDNLIEIGAVEKRRRQTSNEYTVRSSPPRGTSNRPPWPSQKRVHDDSQTANIAVPGGNICSPGRQYLPTSKRKMKEKVEEKEMRAPSAAQGHPKENDKMPPVRESVQEGSRSRGKREKRELPTGRITKRAAPQRGNLYLAQQFKERVELGLQDWVWKLTTSSEDNASKTNCLALAKIFSTWRAQHGWSDADGIAVIDSFVNMVNQGYLRVNKQEETIPWLVFVKQIDKVLAHQEKMGSNGRTGSGWEDTL